MTKERAAEAAPDPWFAKMTTGIAIAASALLALFGWHSLTGWLDLETGQFGSPDRVIAFASLALVTLAAEFAGSRALIYWRQNRTEKGDTGEERLSLLIFAATSLLIIGSGAFGAHMISERMTAGERLQADTAYRVASADAKVSADALAAFEVRAAQEIAPARLAVAMTKGAERRGAIAERDRLEEAHAAERARLANVRQADARKLAAAQVARDQKPQGLPVWLKVGVSILLELLKGSLLFVAAPVGRGRFTLAGIDRQAVSAMTDSELDAAGSQGATLAALVRAEKNRRKSAA